MRDGDRRRYQEKEERGVRGRYNNDHPDFERRRRWRHHDDEDSDGEGHGRRDFGGRDGRGKLAAHDQVYRERERSPRRRNWTGASHQGRQRAGDIGSETHSSLQECMDKALALARTLGVNTASETAGNEALSAPMQPQGVASLISVNGAFSRILKMLPQPPAVAENAPGALTGPSIEAVEEALQQMELLADPPEGQNSAEQQAPLASPVPVREKGGTCISGLFCKPTPPVLQAPAPAPTKAPTPPAVTRRHQRRTFNMSSVRRSTRLAAARPMNQL